MRYRVLYIFLLSGGFLVAAMISPSDAASFSAATIAIMIPLLSLIAVLADSHGDPRVLEKLKYTIEACTLMHGVKVTRENDGSVVAVGWFKGKRVRVQAAQSDIVQEVKKIC